jgi:DNA-binding HxlR family transcriptional regulator
LLIKLPSGPRRFERFQSALGITRHLLAERLKKLVRQGVLRRIPYQVAQTA